MEEVIIKAIKRDLIGKQVKAQRKQGKLPAVIYGRHVEPTPIWLDLRDASKTLSTLRPSSLVSVELESEKHITLVREKQRNHLTGTILHVDFQAVSLFEKLRTEVSVTVFGESPAVKNLNGVLVINMDTLEVECLPQDLPDRIQIDISGLKNIGQSITVKDIKISDAVEVLEDSEAVIVVVTAQESEKEEVTEILTSEPEVLTKSKPEAETS